MTRAEAIKILKAIRVYECYPKSASEETKQAIDMAIEALAEPKRGKWETVIRNEHYPSGREYEADYCSVCGRRGSLEYNYCPCCGARMKGGAE